jgi:DNA-3-methyladenine glycosylase
MVERRKREGILDLASGPAKLTQALGIDRRQNGVDLTGDTLFFSKGKPTPGRVQIGCRIGLSKGRDLPLRFLLAESPYVSRPSSNN